MSVYGHILNSYDCCQLKNSSIASQRAHTSTKMKRRLTSNFREHCQPLLALLSRKIKVNPFTRRSLMPHFFTKKFLPRCTKNARICLRPQTRWALPRSFVGTACACHAILYNSVPVFVTLNVIAGSKRSYPSLSRLLLKRM